MLDMPYRFSYNFTVNRIDVPASCGILKFQHLSMKKTSRFQTSTWFFLFRRIYIPV